MAGARAGLAGARSGLFMEQVRLAKEMRNADELRGGAAIACMTIKCCFLTFQYLCSQAEKRRLLTGKRIIPEMPAGTLLPLC